MLFSFIFYYFHSHLYSLHHSEPFNKHSENNLISYSHQLDNLVIVSSEDPLYTLVVTNTSIKNYMATSIAYIYVCDRPVVKTLHHAVNITSTEAELFAIRCGINQVTNSQWILKIIVVTDLIYSAKKSLTLHHTYSNCIPYLFWVNSGNFSLIIMITLLNSGSAQVNTIGHYIKWSIRKLNHLNPSLSTYVNCLGTLARKVSAMTFYQYGKWFSKLQI